MKIGNTVHITRSINDQGLVSKRKGMDKTQSGKVVHVSDHVIVIDFGNYRESFQMKELKGLHIEAFCIECANQLTDEDRIDGLCNTCAKREEIFK